MSVSRPSGSRQRSRTRSKSPSVGGASFWTELFELHPPRIDLGALTKAGLVRRDGLGRLATTGCCGSGERLESRLEACERGPHHAGADLTRARHLAGHSRVDERRDACLHDLPDVDADGCATVAEGRDPEVRVLGEADLLH